MIRTTIRKASSSIAAREDFKASALTGLNGPAATVGRLPAEYHDSARKALYVVFSYATPIAWVQADGTWFQPTTRYSVTTSKHQSAARLGVTMA